MRSQPFHFNLPSALLLLPALVSAVTLDCKHLRVDGQSFDLSELGGPRSVSLIEDTPPSLTNTTFTIDICNPLQRTKGVAKEDECPSGTRGKRFHVTATWFPSYHFHCYPTIIRADPISQSAE